MGKLVCVLVKEQNILQTTPKIPFKSLRTYEYSKEEFPSVSVVNPWKNANSQLSHKAFSLTSNQSRFFSHNEVSFLSIKLSKIKNVTQFLQENRGNEHFLYV